VTVNLGPGKSLFKRLGPPSLTLALCGGALAGQIDNGLGLEIDWDNTIRFGAAQDVVGQSSPHGRRCDLQASGPALLSTQDCQQPYGATARRFDWWTELDIGAGDFGLHATVDSWYDWQYDKQTSDNLPVVLAPDLAGRRLIVLHSPQTGDGAVDLRDLFFYGKAMIADDEPVSFRLGRHALLWGESLFFTENGIAAGQVPVDSYLYQAVASYQSSDAFLPVNQISASWQPANGLAVDLYYQFEWRRSQISPYNAYASDADVIGADNLRLIGLDLPGLGPTLFSRARDQTPGSTDQFGAALKLQRGDIDYGLYGLSFNTKSPIAYLRAPAAAGGLGSYTLTYPKGIGLIGASMSGPLGPATIGGEVSGRWNMPLVTGGVLVPPGAQADNNDHPLYPVGDTVHAQLSWNYPVPPFSFLPGGASWTAEIAANDRVAVTANEGALAPGRTRFAAGFRTVFEPQFFQVLPRLDLTLPIGFGFNFLGVSSVDSTMNRGTGDVSLGIAATFDQVWRAEFDITHYFGHSKNAVVPLDASAAGPLLQQFDFVALSLERSF